MKTRMTWNCLGSFIACVFAGDLELSSSPSNVLFIAVDDLADTLGCLDDVIAKTPNMDRLAASGVVFTRAYNQIPLCNPSRASVMTGRRPDATRVYDLDQHFRETLPNVVTMPQAFMRAGWLAARVGKIYHYNVPAGIGTNGNDDPQSWQQVFNPKGRDKAEEHLIFNAEPQRKISAALSWLAAEGADEEQTDGMIASAAIRYLETHRDEAFFLATGFFRPHTPYVAPQKYFDLYPLDLIRLPYAPLDDRQDIPDAAFAHNCPIPDYGLDALTLRKAIQAYYACVSFVDAQIGRMLDALVRLGLDKNTIVVLWSDHGYHLGEHQGVWQKRTLFEKVARTPLIMRVPGMQGNGMRCQRVVEFVDIYPTLTDLAKIHAPASLEGRSLVPLLEDPTRAWGGHAVTQILRAADNRLREHVMGASVRTERWRYTQWGEQGRHGIELYDYHADPGEFRNLAIKPSQDIRLLIQGLKKLLLQKAATSTPQTPFQPSRL